MHTFTPAAHIVITKHYLDPRENVAVVGLGVLGLGASRFKVLCLVAASLGLEIVPSG